MQKILEYLAKIGLTKCQRESKIIRRIYDFPSEFENVGTRDAPKWIYHDTTITPSQRSSVSRSLSRLMELGFVESERHAYAYEYAPIKDRWGEIIEPSSRPRKEWSSKPYFGITEEGLNLTISRGIITSEEVGSVG